MNVKESDEKSALEDTGRISIPQDILRKNADFLRRIIAPVSGVGGVTFSYVRPHCRCFPLEDNIWWVSSGHADGNNRKKMQCNWCAACGGQYEWRAPNSILDTQDSVDPREARVFRPHDANLVNALKLLTNRQKDCDNPVEHIVTGLLEKSRQGIMNRLG